MSDSIPKFLSSKPKPKKDEVPASSDSRLEPSRSHNKHSYGHDDDLRRAKRRQSDRSKVQRNRDVDDDARRRGSKVDAAPVAQPNKTYTVDALGDIGNLKYGSLHKYDIPQYYRTGYGRILGLGDSLKIDRDQTTQSRIYLQYRHSHDETKTRQFLHNRGISKIRPRTVKIETGQGAFGTDQSFIPLSKSRKRKRRSASPAQTPVDYRGLDSDKGARPEDKTDDSALESDSSEESLAQDDGAAARLRNAELTRQTRDDPANAGAWASLIQHQAELVAPGLEPAALSTTQRRAVSEMRLALYEKVNKVVHLSAKPDFIRAMLDEGSNLWSAATRLTKWEEAVFQYPSDILLWRRFLDLIQNSEQESNWEKIKLCFVNLLRRLQVVREAIGDDRTAKTLGIAQIYIVLRLMHLMYDMGYQELSVATWQALVDLHICKAQQNTSYDTRLKLVEQQWDDEEYRFGEEATHDSDGVHTPTDLSTGIIDAGAGARGAFTTFARRERHLSIMMELPGKTTDDTDETALQDAMHVVFFSDMVDILENTKAGLDPDGLVDALLCFCGLPSTISIDGTLWPWRDDSILASMSAQDCLVGKELDRETTLLPQRFVITSETLWREDCFPPWLKQDRPLTMSLINHGLQQLINMDNSNSDLKIYWLAFQTSYYPELAPKTAKRLIKLSPSDLHLYNAAANIEARLNRYDKADRIWSTAIQMGTNFDPASEAAQHQYNHDILELAYTWSMSALERNNPSLALSRLFSIRPSTVLPPSSSTLLSFHHDLLSSHTLAQHHRRPHSSALSLSTLSLLTYLTSSPPSLDSALAVLPREPPTEPLSQFTTRLITLHLDAARPYRPASLLPLLAAWPQNTLLLSLHARLTQHTSVLASLATTAPAPAAVWDWGYALARARGRYAVLGAGGGGAEAVRALFRAATREDSSVRHCRALWGEWLGFEVRVLAEVEGRNAEWERGRKDKGRGRDERTVQWARIRGVYFAGLRAVPWSRDWVLRGLELFEREGGMVAEELRGLYGVLFERDMRVRVDMEDHGGNMDTVLD